jgi:hypothetical protein
MNIFFVGTHSVPLLNRAVDYRLFCFAKSYQINNNKVFIINRYNLDNTKIKYGINIFNLLNLTKSKFNFIFLPLIYINEFVKLIYIKNKINIDLIKVYSSHFIDFLFYKLIYNIV